MTGHPKPEQIRELREKLRLTQAQAADVIEYSVRAWQQWEAGTRKMRPTLWKTFLEKVGVNKE
jgi:DNA-binding transcriptional regulator YiaG